MIYTAKAIAAFIGAIVTALLASGIIPVDGTLQTVLTLISIIATAVATYNVRNNGVDVPRVKAE
jgi:hypothetical protein